MEVELGAGVVRKVAGSDADRKRLEREARTLRSAAHPGVVRLIDVAGGGPPSELILSRVEGGDLRALDRGLDWSEIAGLGAALATTVADLHHIGFVHRAISAEHVLLDNDGRPVLCGFGEATRVRDRAEARSALRDDVAALAHLLLQLGDGNPPRGLNAALQLSRSRRRLSGALDARALAQALIRAEPAARLPGSSARASRAVSARRGEHGRHRAVIRGGVVVAFALGLTGSVIGIRSLFASGGRGEALAGCPRPDRGCLGRPVVSGSVLRSPIGAFSLVGPAGIEVNGRWDCGSIALPAVLDLARGNVWVFDGWPSDPSGVPARLLQKVPAAAGLRVVPGSGRSSSCDLLQVTRRQGPALVLLPDRFDGHGPANPLPTGSARQPGAHP